ncbi:hypothetical protein GE21DRAFT_4626 [Neurospora crassa]|uniref:Uncharacterized protein n=1 Tax=Neurospora crassa (strain ATCC 24698 / 74-OR23-1A / CBS 708.71 / DSM 1257 / FGSC 987) TaxID=367110 RepID=Q7RZQ0_NEUCR|nr:hypothetical protein NCU00314 [Neurospora crassa OR74A]EAA28549.1 hypothetical protein NCU00314 [Neurospora crassa OR74A]KHE89582.1 hypothetical protein GE21DRAFT_4626 [Neurospora crassa]|eukprot:XP_957785.1 hypothetical protein NCU00314 [Neurospora crassa OR74A]
MSRPRPPPLQLNPVLPTPPATPDKHQHHQDLTSTSPKQTAWTPLEPKSVRFALPLAQTPGHKSKFSTTATFRTHHSQTTKAKSKRIPAKPYSASLNRLMVRYYALVQSLCEPDLPESKFKSKVAGDRFPSESRGILAPPPSPISPVQGIQIQIRQRKPLQAIRSLAHASIYKPLTAIAPVLTLPLLPSQEAEKEVRKVLKRAKKGLKILEELVASKPQGSNLELDLDLDQKMGIDEMDLNRELAHVGSGDRMDLDLNGSGSADMHSFGPGRRLGAAECRRDSQKMMTKEREMEAIQEGVAMMSLEETRGLPHLRVPGRKVEGLSSAGFCGTGVNWEGFQGEVCDDIVGRKEQAQDEAVLTGVGGLTSV